jgi:hypothetical protein
MKTWAFLLVVIFCLAAVLVITAGLAVGYFVKSTSLGENIFNLKKSVAESQIEPATEDTLIYAASLIPGVVDSIKGERLGKNLFVVLRKLTDGQNETWIINTATGETKLTKTRTLIPDVGAETQIIIEPWGRFIVFSQVAWEGPPFIARDFYNLSTGELLFSSEWEGGQSINVSKGDKSLKISYYPSEECTKYRTGPAKEVMVTGLFIDGTKKLFSNPHKILCYPNELIGEGLLADFGQPYYAADDKIRFSLPFAPAANVTVDPSNLTVDGVTILESAFR